MMGEDSPIDTQDSRPHGVVAQLGVALAAFGLVIAMVSTIARASATPSITLAPVDIGFPNPIDIGYDKPFNSLVVSVNYRRGEPRNFALLHAKGKFTPFGSTHGLTDEVYIAAIRPSLCQKGFVTGDLYFGTGRPGVVARLSDNGAKFTDPWVRLPNEQGLLRGGIQQDLACVAGGDLIVTTTRGNVWRVSAAGAAKRVAHIGPVRKQLASLEGVTTVPNNPARYGPWAGQILAAGEQVGVLFSIDPSTGKVGRSDVQGGAKFPGAESVVIVPPNQNFFGVNFGAGKLEGASVAQFAELVGDVLVATEVQGRLIDVRWNGTSFVEADLLAHDVGRWEGVGFAPVGLPGLPAPAPTPTSQVLAIPSTGSATVGQGIPWPLVIFIPGFVAVALAVRAVGRKPQTP